jgi:hypothetical protein
LGDDKGFVTNLDFTEVFKEIKERLSVSSGTSSKRTFEQFRLKNSEVRIKWRKKIHKEEIFSIRINECNGYLMTTSIDKNVRERLTEGSHIRFGNWNAF